MTPLRAILDGAENLRGDLLRQAIETARRLGLVRRGNLEILDELAGRYSDELPQEESAPQREGPAELGP